MFNEDIKQAYLETLTGSSRSATQQLFVAAEPFEAARNTDLANFLPNDLGSLLVNFGFAEPDLVRTRKALAASYADWYCNQMGVRGHHIREYDIFEYPYKELFATVLTLEPEQLTNRIAQVYPADSGQPAMPALCFAWMGLDCAEAVALKPEQVDVKVGVILDESGEAVVQEIPKSFAELLLVYSETQEAVRVQNQTFTVYADNAGFFIKQMKTKRSGKPSGAFSSSQMSGKIRSLRDVYIARFGKGTGEWASYTNVQRSGNFYRLHQLAKSGVDVYDIRNKDLVRSILGKSKRNHKDNMVLYTAYKEIREEAGLD